MTILYGKGRARLHCLTIAYRTFNRRKGAEEEESRLSSRNGSNGAVKDSDAPARMPMRGILAGCCGTTITPIASSAIATKIDDRPAWFIFHTLFLPGLSRYKSKDGSESWRDLRQRNATRIGRPELAVL